MKKLSLALALILILMLALTACGGSDANTDGNTNMGDDTAMEEKEPVTLTVLIHQHPPLVEYMEAFNARFEEAYPYVTVDMSVVNAADLATVTQTRLTANDIDVIDMAGFANAAQPYMIDVTPPNWQTLIDAGLLMDLSGQDFLANYQDAAIATGSYNGGVYQLPVGTTIYSGVFYNVDMFEEYSVGVPTTWDELVAACETFAAADIACMTSGGADGWPLFVGAYGLLGSTFPDQYALAEGLWSGDIKMNDAQWLDLWGKLQVYADDFMAEGATGITHDGAPSAFAAGEAAMLPMGSWNAAMIQGADPDMNWDYIPFPGSNNAADNTYWFGKYDMGWSAAANKKKPWPTWQCFLIQQSIRYSSTPSSSFRPKAVRPSKAAWVMQLPAMQITSALVLSRSGLLRPAPASGQTHSRKQISSNPLVNGMILRLWLTRHKKTCKPG